MSLIRIGLAQQKTAGFLVSPGSRVAISPFPRVGCDGFPAHPERSHAY